MHDNVQSLMYMYMDVAAIIGVIYTLSDTYTCLTIRDMDLC